MHRREFFFSRETCPAGAINSIAVPINISFSPKSVAALSWKFASAKKSAISRTSGIHIFRVAYSVGNPAGIHDCDAGSKAECLPLVMGGLHAGDPGLVLQPFQINRHNSGIAVLQ